MRKKTKTEKTHGSLSILELFGNVSQASLSVRFKIEKAWERSLGNVHIFLALAESFTVCPVQSFFFLRVNVFFKSEGFLLLCDHCGAGERGEDIGGVDTWVKLTPPGNVEVLKMHFLSFKEMHNLQITSLSNTSVKVFLYHFIWQLLLLLNINLMWDSGEVLWFI